MAAQLLPDQARICFELGMKTFSLDAFSRALLDGGADHGMELIAAFNSDLDTFRTNVCVLFGIRRENFENEFPSASDLRSIFGLLIEVQHRIKERVGPVAFDWFMLGNRICSVKAVGSCVKKTPADFDKEVRENLNPVEFVRILTEKGIDQEFQARIMDLINDRCAHPVKDFRVRWTQIENELRLKLFPVEPAPRGAFFQPPPPPPPPAAVRTFTSEIDEEQIFTDESWKVWLARKTNVGNRQHVFILVEGSVDGHRFLWYADLVLNLNNNAAIIRTQNIVSPERVAGPADDSVGPKFIFALNLNDLIGAELARKYWIISPEQGLRLKQNIEEEKIRNDSAIENHKPPIIRYRMTGRDSISVSVDDQAHNCYTWARNHLRELGHPYDNDPVLETTITDRFFAAVPSRHIIDPRESVIGSCTLI